HDEKARRFRAAASDAEQQPHLQLRNPLLVENLDLESGFSRDLGAAVCKHARSQAVAGLVRERACDVAAFTEHAAALEGAFECRRLARHAKLHRLDPRAWL